jgi:hypothetical protein
MWLRNILKELQFEVKQSLSLFMDNQSAVQVAKNPEHHGRMKHLDLAFYWLRDMVDKDFIKPEFVSTLDNPADLLTKALQPVLVFEDIEPWTTCDCNLLVSSWCCSSPYQSA